ncbi:hypothetical protein J6590_002894 [Homalodisca vitripennis]|nr:hypothetical protein J6590_002894 [Homalodisca vitripennis]
MQYIRSRMQGRQKCDNVVPNGLYRIELAASRSLSRTSVTNYNLGHYLQPRSLSRTSVTI